MPAILGKMTKGVHIPAINEFTDPLPFFRKKACIFGVFFRPGQVYFGMGGVNISCNDDFLAASCVIFRLLSERHHKISS